MRNFVIRGKKWYNTPLKAMAKTLAIVVLFVCALAAPQVLAQSDERQTLSASDEIMKGIAEVSVGDILFVVLMAMLGLAVVVLAIRAAVSIIWALLPLVLLGLGGFILFQKHFGNEEVPNVVFIIGMGALGLGVFLGNKQLGVDADEKQKQDDGQSHNHELEQPENLEIKIGAARFETPLKDDLRKISAAVFSVMHEENFSGFLIAKDKDFGYAMTSHVTGGEEPFGIKRIGMDEPAAGKCVITSEDLNVSLIAVDFTDVRPLRINTNLPEVGDDVYAIGSPMDTAFEGTLTRGVVGSIREDEDGGRYIQSDVGIAPGSDGGPLFDKWGNVIGIASVIMQHDDNPAPVNLFVPIADALKHLGIKH